MEAYWIDIDKLAPQEDAPAEIAVIQKTIYDLCFEIGQTQELIQKKIQLDTLSAGADQSTLYAAITRIIASSQSSITELIWLRDFEKYKEYELLRARNQVITLKKLLKSLKSILGSFKYTKFANPEIQSFNFLTNNKLPAPADDEDLKRVRLPIAQAEEVADLLDLTDKEMANILTVSIRTYHRLKLSGLMNPVASERLLMLKELAAYGLEVFEDQSNFNSWLRLPLQVLGNKSPLSLLDTATGFNSIKTILERIEYGVYS